MFHKLQFIADDFKAHPEQPLTTEADRFSTFYRKLNSNCQECPSNNILNALTYKYTLYYLQDVANDTLNFMKMLPEKASADVSSSKFTGEVHSDLNDSSAAVNTTFIKRLSSHGRDPRTKWVCAVCRDGCKVGDTWYTLCNCKRKFHIQCIGNNQTFVAQFFF